MSKPLKNVLEPSNEADAQHDVAVAAAVELAMEFYGCDAVTAAAKRAFEAMMGMRKIDIAAIEAALKA